ncbi:NAD(P)-dependent dehydrogenase (short-subunit alcohol dehydrogenase family) [Catalinimonas alkaloidigena]|uniref:SDR family NAD(P)-dependent oxidoreductase n=1 Tax=Catalinimonas alkaloidigena TaxID=1075417 RepID=UPI00240544D6|nr:SDR family NAD(P)-dependent oxidoreductase [Catalinimonas alkaloidigena]MDF9796860.1 NAD(P)-dependent dehydrogenase (short-subunit alcohol dehydrogenase family) [Catalinimonas alkaloidigena]
MNIIITGGHSGMGFDLTKKLLAEGHLIGLIVRSETRKQETKKLFPNDSQIEIFVADLSNRNEIKEVAKAINSKWNHLDGLFNNTGVLLDKLYTSDYGNELQLEINAISPYLLTLELLPLLEKSDNPFVVNTATGSLERKKSLNIPSFKKPKKFVKLMGSYMDSKITMVTLMNHLSEQHPKVHFVSVNPGLIKTKMSSGSGMPFFLKPIRNLLFKSPEFGANNLYNGAFNNQYKDNGLFVSDKKIRPIQVKITQPEIDLLLQTS